MGWFIAENAIVISVPAIETPASISPGGIVLDVRDTRRFVGLARDE